MCLIACPRDCCLAQAVSFCRAVRLQRMQHSGSGHQGDLPVRRPLALPAPQPSIHLTTSTLTWSQIPAQTFECMDLCNFGLCTNWKGASSSTNGFDACCKHRVTTPCNVHSMHRIIAHKYVQASKFLLTHVGSHTTGHRLNHLDASMLFTRHPAFR